MSEDVRNINNRYRKLHLVVSEQLFQKIIEHGQLQDIDSLVANLLADYFDGKEGSKWQLTIKLKPKR